MVRYKPGEIEDQREKEEKRLLNDLEIEQIKSYIAEEKRRRLEIETGDHDILPEIIMKHKETSYKCPFCGKTLTERYQNITNLVKATLLNSHLDDCFVFNVIKDKIREDK